MPPPNDPLASYAARVMFDAHEKRILSGATQDGYPSSHSDLVWCAIALIDAGLIPRWDDLQLYMNSPTRRQDG